MNTHSFPDVVRRDTPILGANRLSRSSPSQSGRAALRDAFSHAEAVYQRLPIAGDLRFEDNRLFAGDHSCRVTTDALGRLCQAVGAPPGYVRQLPARMRTELVQYHLDQSDYLGPGQSPGDAAMIVHNDQFVSFGRSDLAELRASEVVDAISEGIGTQADEVELHRLHTGDHRFECDLVSHAVSEAVQPGDVIRGGLRIVYSPLGRHATRIEAFVLRLVCSNGMTHRDCLGQKSISRTRRLSANHPQARTLEYEQVRKLTAETWQGLPASLTAIKSLRQEPAPVQELLTRFLRQARMYSQATLRLLESAWESEGREATTYAALNALTNVATHSELSGLQRRSLATLAGVLAHSGTHICPQCFSVISRNA